MERPVDEPVPAWVWIAPVLLAVPLGATALIAGLLGMVWTCGWCVVAMWTVLTVPRNPLVVSLVLGVVLLGTGARWLPVPAIELGQSMDRMQIEVRAHGAEALSPSRRMGVYGFNGAMGLAGHVLGLHEVGWLTWELALPGPTDRYRSGAFLLRDPSVRRVVRGWKGRSGKQRDSVAWSSYFGADVSPSVALAANCPLVMEGVPRPGGIAVEARCEVAYPRDASLQLGRIEGQRVQIFEGAFWVLQEAGWLRPFTVRWTLDVDWDDPRLSGDRAVLGTREAIWAGAM